MSNSRFFAFSSFCQRLDVSAVSQVNSGYIASISRASHHEYQPMITSEAKTLSSIGRKLLANMFRKPVVSVIERCSREMIVPVSSLSK